MINNWGDDDDVGPLDLLVPMLDYNDQFALSFYFALIIVTKKAFVTVNHSFRRRLKISMFLYFMK